MPKAVEHMVQIAKVLTHNEREKLIIPLIMDCIKDREDEDRRFTAVVLSDSLCEVLG